MLLNFLPSSVIVSSIYPPGRDRRPLTTKMGSRSAAAPLLPSRDLLPDRCRSLEERVLKKRRQRMVRGVVDHLSVERPVPIVVSDEPDIAVGVEVHAPDLAADFLAVDRVRDERQPSLLARNCHAGYLIEIPHERLVSACDL